MTVRQLIQVLLNVDLNMPVHVSIGGFPICEGDDMPLAHVYNHRDEAGKPVVVLTTDRDGYANLRPKA